MLTSLLALQGQHPLVQGTLIVLGTFVLEDAATVLAAMGAQTGQVDPAVALREDG